jgi:hypothetical protein
MKKILLFILLYISTLSCSHHYDDPQPVSELDKLPPATQTGANTFGCLLDGVAFKPGITNNSYNCFYQFVNGEYYFNVNASNQKYGILKGIGIGTEKKTISEGQTLNLFERINGNAYGTYYVGNSNTGLDDLMYTSTYNTGQLIITKLDFTHNIVSGTFWFNVIDSQNVVHHITDGRFDMQFSQ